MKARQDFLGCGNFLVGQASPITSWPMNEDERKAMIGGNKSTAAVKTTGQFGSLTSMPQKKSQVLKQQKN
jgi:hypothetical protein